MNALTSPETEAIASIERLELEAREYRRKVAHAKSEADKRVLNRQLKDLQDQIVFLRQRLK